jgi:hypothetical protein
MALKRAIAWSYRAIIQLMRPKAQLKIDQKVIKNKHEFILS